MRRSFVEKLWPFVVQLVHDILCAHFATFTFYERAYTKNYTIVQRGGHTLSMKCGMWAGTFLGSFPYTELYKLCTCLSDSANVSIRSFYDKRNNKRWVAFEQKKNGKSLILLVGTRDEEDPFPKSAPANHCFEPSESAEDLVSVNQGK